MKKLLSIIFALSLFLPCALIAQGSFNNTLGIGPRLGYYQSPDADNGNFYFGGHMRMRFSRVFGFEAALEYRTASEYERADGGSVSVSQVPLTGSLLLFIPLTNDVVPYGFGGLGAYYTNYRCDGGLFDCSDDSNFNLGYHLGVGLELPLNESVGLSGDYRYLFLNPEENESNLDDASFSGSVFSLGVTFYL